MAEVVKITISKEDARSRVLGEVYTAYLDKKQVSPYVELIQKIWPSTKIRQ